METGSERDVGKHEKAVKCIEWLSERQLVASSSWDCSLKVWDLHDSKVSFISPQTAK